MTRILLALALIRLSMNHDYWFLIFAIAWMTWELLKLDDWLYEKRRLSE
ncbi:hypothetical protein [Enterococcus italicus]